MGRSAAARRSYIRRLLRRRQASSPPSPTKDAAAALRRPLRPDRRLHRLSMFPSSPLPAGGSPGVSPGGFPIVTPVGSPGVSPGGFPIVTPVGSPGGSPVGTPVGCPGGSVRLEVVYRGELSAASTDDSFDLLIESSLVGRSLKEKDDSILKFEEQMPLSGYAFDGQGTRALEAMPTTVEVFRATVSDVNRRLFRN